MKEKFYAIVDTETLGGVTDGFCHAYHLGAVAINRKGIIQDNIDILILENLCMDNAYYGKMKKEYYRELLKKESTKIAYTENEALEMFTDWLETNYITTLCAYNSGFDFCKTLLCAIVNEYEFIDILYAFKDTIAKQKKYSTFCKENNYLTNYGGNRMTAEIAYRFISGNNDFVEEHTALSDAEIETVILIAIWATHQKFTRNQHLIRK